MQKVKEARQKKIAIVGGVLLLAIVAFQAPRTMKLLNGADETAAAPPPATTAATTPAATTPAPAAAGGGGETGRAPDAAPEPTAGQLVSFTRFASKDPFVQQIDRSAAAPASGGGDAPVSSDDEDTPAAQAPSAAAGGGVQPSAGSGAAPPVTETGRGTATIAVNDLEETVAVGTAFPTAAPLFRLVKVTATTAQVAIAGGSYASGEATATLRLGRTLVLQNTADGTSYELRLVEVS